MVAEPQPTRIRGLRRAVDDRRGLPGLHHHGRAAVDLHLDRLAVAQGQQRVAGDAALGLRPAGQVVHAAERQHLRAVFGGGDMADRFALRRARWRLGAEEAVGVDLHLHAAVGRCLGHHGDHVDALDPGETMKGAGL
jgi:hypothetical protein